LIRAGIRHRLEGRARKRTVMNIIQSEAEINNPIKVFSLISSFLPPFLPLLLSTRVAHPAA
jgi:hypothetical protein